MNEKTKKRNIIKNNYAEEKEREKTKVEERQRETRSKE